MFRVVQWATGSMGRTALRRIIDHPDLELVGVHVYDPRKAGRDAGDLVRRPATGVLASSRIEDIIALRPDVVIHAPRLSEPYELQNAEVLRLLQAGINVISTAGFHHPDAHGPAYAGPLREACRVGGSTLAGLGLNPGFIVERIAVALTGMCAQLSSIACHEIADASSMPAAEFVFGMMGFGSDPAVRDITRGPLARLYEELFGEVFHAVADALGTRLERLLPEHALSLAPNDITIRAGTIRAGTVSATEWRWRGEFADGRCMLYSVLWTADPGAHGAKPHSAAQWRLELSGRPNIHVTIVIEDPDPGAPHMRAATDATVAIALRAIPDVCAAPAGFYRVPVSGAFRERFAEDVGVAKR
jgi:hypothetical protein